MRIGKINALPSESAGPVLDFGGVWVHFWDTFF